MERYEFTSIFTNEINDYINYKVNAGYCSNSFRSAFIKFDKFCNEYQIKTPAFTDLYALKWKEKNYNEGEKTYYSRINIIKHFLLYLNVKGYNVCQIRDVKYRASDFEPYIYTDVETENYFFAVDNYTSKKNRKSSIQYPVLFRILYCCGTRINETLGLRKKDIDLEKGILLLNETKNNCQRYVVVGDDLKKLLNDYANKCFYMLKDDDYIFSNANGGRLNGKTVYETHRSFLLKAKIPYIGDGKGPRIHDWRHHMAVHSFKQMLDSGLDMYVAIPILSAYLGHKSILSTERYVRLTMQLFPYIEEKFHKIIDQIFGGITYEND